MPPDVPLGCLDEVGPDQRLDKNGAGQDQAWLNQGSSLFNK